METAHFSPQLWFRRLTTWGCLFFLRFSWVKWCVIKCWISYDSSHSWSQWALPSIQAFRCSWKASVPAGDNPAVPAECALDQIWIPSCSGHDVAPTFRLERLWNSFIFHHISWYFMIFHEIPIDSYRFLIWVCLKIWYCTLNSNGLSSFSPYPIPFPAVCPISAGQIHILHGQSTMFRHVSSSTYLNPPYPPSLSRVSPVEVGAKVKWIWRLVPVVWRIPPVRSHRDQQPAGIVSRPSLRCGSTRSGCWERTQLTQARWSLHVLWFFFSIIQETMIDCDRSWDEHSLAGVFDGNFDSHFRCFKSHGSIVVYYWLLYTFKYF